MQNTRQTIRVHFDDLLRMRQFRIYLLAANIDIHESSIDRAGNRGWVDCAIDDAEQEKTIALFNCRTV